MNFLTGSLFIGSALALAASTVDEKAKAFEDALGKAPVAEVASNPGVREVPPAATSLEAMLQRHGSEALLESLASQLIATHPSAAVRKTGEDFIQAVEAQRRHRAQEFTTKAKAVLAEAKDAVTHAKKAADLDKVLGELQGLARPSQLDFTDQSTQLLAEKVTATFQFVRAWQDYLSASAAGKTAEAKEALRPILDNPQLDALAFFPRSQILERRDGAPVEGTSVAAGDPYNAINAILTKVRKVDDVTPALNEIGRISKESFNFSAISELEHKRDDLMAGLPTTLNLRSAMNGNFYGDDISRITSLELLAILPFYLDTQTSNPPKPGETVDGYLDRLARGGQNTYSSH